MLQGEHSAIFFIFIKLPFVIKNFVLSIFEWPFHGGFTVFKPKITGFRDGNFTHLSEPETADIPFHRNHLCGHVSDTFSLP